MNGARTAGTRQTLRIPSDLSIPVSAGVLSVESECPLVVGVTAAGRAEGIGERPGQKGAVRRRGAEDEAQTPVERNPTGVLPAAAPPAPVGTARLPVVTAALASSVRHRRVLRRRWGNAGPSISGTPWSALDCRSGTARAIRPRAWPAGHRPWPAVHPGAATSGTGSPAESDQRVVGRVAAAAERAEDGRDQTHLDVERPLWPGADPREQCEWAGIPPPSPMSPCTRTSRGARAAAHANAAEPVEPDQPEHAVGGGRVVEPRMVFGRQGDRCLAADGEPASGGGDGAIRQALGHCGRLERKREGQRRAPQSRIPRAARNSLDRRRSDGERRAWHVHRWIFAIIAWAGSGLTSQHFARPDPMS